MTIKNTFVIMALTHIFINDLNYFINIDYQMLLFLMNYNYQVIFTHKHLLF